MPEGRLSSDYGPRSVDPVTGESKAGDHHHGYDLAAAMGTPIRASKAGTVAFAGRKGGYGNAVILDHPGGWSTLYGHASRLAVDPGQRVEAGQVVAYVGSTGHSTGPHLHYELRRNGSPVDPGLFTASASRSKASRTTASVTARKTKTLAARPHVAESQASRDASSAVPPEAFADKTREPAAPAVAALPENAPPLRYPDDPQLHSAVAALDGASMPSKLLTPSEPPARWQRLKNWLAEIVQRVASLLSIRFLS